MEAEIAYVYNPDGSAEREVMLNNKDFSDATFVVNGAQFYALSHIVRVYSPVLKEMIDEHFKNCGDLVLKIELIKDNDSFNIILRYMYGLRIKFSEKSEAVLCEVVCLSDRFELPKLTNKVKTYLSQIENFQMDSIVNSLNMAKQACLNELFDKLFIYAKNNAEQLVSHESFVDLQYDILQDLVKSDELGIKEIDILRAVLVWHNSNMTKIKTEEDSHEKAKDLDSEDTSCSNENIKHDCETCLSVQNKKLEESLETISQKNNNITKRNIEEDSHEKTEDIKSAQEETEEGIETKNKSSDLDSEDTSCSNENTKHDCETCLSVQNKKLEKSLETISQKNNNMTKRNIEEDSHEKAEDIKSAQEETEEVIETKNKSSDLDSEDASCSNENIKHDCETCISVQTKKSKKSVETFSHKNNNMIIRNTKEESQEKAKDIKSAQEETVEVIETKNKSSDLDSEDASCSNENIKHDCETCISVQNKKLKESLETISQNNNNMTKRNTEEESQEKAKDIKSAQEEIEEVIETKNKSSDLDSEDASCSNENIKHDCVSVQNNKPEESLERTSQNNNNMTKRNTEEELLEKAEDIKSAEEETEEGSETKNKSSDLDSEDASCCKENIKHDCETCLSVQNKKPEESLEQISQKNNNMTKINTEEDSHEKAEDIKSAEEETEEGSETKNKSSDSDLKIPVAQTRISNTIGKLVFLSKPKNLKNHWKQSMKKNNNMTKRNREEDSHEKAEDIKNAQEETEEVIETKNKSSDLDSEDASCSNENIKHDCVSVQNKKPEDSLEQISQKNNNTTKRNIEEESHKKPKDIKRAQEETEEGLKTNLDSEEAIESIKHDLKYETCLSVQLKKPDESMDTFSENILKDLLAHIHMEKISVMELLNLCASDIGMKYKGLIINNFEHIPCSVAPENSEPGLHNETHALDIAKKFTFNQDIYKNTLYHSEDEYVIRDMKWNVCMKVSNLPEDICRPSIFLKCSSEKLCDWECVVQCHVKMNSIIPALAMTGEAVYITVKLTSEESCVEVGDFLYPYVWRKSFRKLYNAAVVPFEFVVHFKQMDIKGKYIS